MTAIEIVATVLGLTNVYLIVRRNIWNYPFGLAMVILYAKIFYDYKLYSDALLQIYYVLIQFYGWWYWLRGRQADGLITVSRLAAAQRALTLGVIVVGSAGLGWVMATKTDASVPYWDAATTVMSLMAQFLLSRRCIENWVLWIAVDVLSIGIYTYKALYLTAGLYTVFLAMATWGLLAWLRAERQQSDPVEARAAAGA